MTTAVCCLNSCAVTIHDFQACSPIPGNYGAVCDNFLKSNPQTLDATEWLNLQIAWMKQGWAVECVNSKAVADMKGEIEKLCSVYHCTQEQSFAVSRLLSGLKRVEASGAAALQIPN